MTVDCIHSFIITYFIFFQQLYFLTFDSSLLLRKKIWWLQRDTRRYNFIKHSLQYNTFAFLYFLLSFAEYTHCILENERVFQTYRFMSFLRLVVHDYLRGVSAAKNGRTRKAIIHMFWWASESDPNYWTQSLQFFLAIDCHIYLAYERNSKRLFHNGILWLCCDGGIDMAYHILTSFSSLLKSRVTVQKYDMKI